MEEVEKNVDVVEAKNLDYVRQPPAYIDDVTWIQSNHFKLQTLILNKMQNVFTN